MANQADTYHLEKRVWTESDFKQMGWHDANIYGIVIQPISGSWTGDFLLDIDYIFQWVHPVPPEKYF